MLFCITPFVTINRDMATTTWQPRHGNRHGNRETTTANWQSRNDYGTLGELVRIVFMARR